MFKPSVFEKPLKLVEKQTVKQIDSNEPPEDVAETVEPTAEREIKLANELREKEEINHILHDLTEPDESAEKQNTLVLDNFKNNFNISKEDLEGVKDFFKLTKVQQILVYEYLKQKSLSDIRERAKIYIRFEEEKKLKKISTEMSFWQRSFIKIYNLIYKFRSDLVNKDDIPEQEKIELSEIKNGGLRINQNNLEEIIKKILDIKVDAILNSLGEVEINYLSVDNSFEDEEAEILLDFDYAASKFSQLPYKWSEAMAKAEKKKEYIKLQVQYEEAKSEALEILSKKFKNNKKAVLKIKEIDHQIQVLQSLTECLNIDEELLKIEQ
jgi:hypothetical protein